MTINQTQPWERTAGPLPSPHRDDGRGCRWGSGRWLGLLAAAWVVSFGLAGCSNGETATPIDTGGVADVGGGGGNDAGDDATAPVDGAVGGGDAGGGDAVVTGPAEDFWVLYNRRKRIFAEANDNDVVLTGWVNPGALSNASMYGIGVHPFEDAKKAIALTEYSFTKTEKNCNYGCFISPDVRFIAIAEAEKSSGGFTNYTLGTMNEGLEVFVGKFGLLKDVAHLEFSGPYLFYSTPSQCLSTGKCQFAIHRRTMAAATDSQVGDDIVLTVMTPTNDIDFIENDTTYNGYFRVSHDAKTLVFLSTTIRSVKVYAWREGTLHEMDWICEHPIGEGAEKKCVGTGSQYHDNDPAAIAPDGKTIVFFTVVDRWLRARKYTIGSAAAASFSNLAEVPSGGAYLQNYCGAIAPWQHGQVVGQPYFSANGETLYYLGLSNCGDLKPYTDIVGIATAKVGDGTPVTESDLVNFTNNPRDDSVDNRWIRSFTMSPERKVFVIEATPWYGSSGEKLGEQDKRQTNDTELYSLASQLGAQMVQITNEASYATDAPLAYAPLGQ